jgi:hypothetical protein
MAPGQILPLLTSSKYSLRASCHVTDSYGPLISSRPAHNSAYIVPFLIPAGSGTSFVGLRCASEIGLISSNEVVLSQDFQVPFNPGTQVCRAAFDGSILLIVLFFFLYLVSNMHGTFPVAPRFSVAVARIAHYGTSGTHWGYQVAARIFTPSFPIPLPLHRTQRPARM